MRIIDQIELAFSGRAKPVVVVRSNHPSTEIYNDAEAFANKDWRETTCQDWNANTNAIFGFTPDAFCYFLPGIFAAGIRNNCPELAVNDSLVQMLDRSNMPSSWDDFFLERWPRLSPAECEATQRWILWLVEANPPVIAENSLSRAFDTINLIANQAIASPMASR